MAYSREQRQANAAASGVSERSLHAGDQVGDWHVCEVFRGPRRADGPPGSCRTGKLMARLCCRVCLYEKTVAVYNLRALKNRCLWRREDPRRHRGRPGHIAAV